MYDEDDPFLRELRPIALALPQAQQKISHGHPVFYTKKIFAIFGAMVKGDHGDRRHAQSVVFLPDELERAALVAEDRFFVPAYYGPSGWLGLDLRAEPPDWQEVAELLEMSYRNTAPATLCRELDEPR